jgi:hypothetical protein
MSSIQLDTTLTDLFHQHGIEGDFVFATHCIFAHLDLHPNFPGETTFAEDEEPVPHGDDEQEIYRLRKTILGLKQPRRAFGLGNADVICFSPYATPKSFQRSLNQISPEQRHKPQFVDLDRGHVVEQIQEIMKNRLLVYWRPQGWMRQLNCLVKPDLAYELNSKEYLITSGIRTPKSEIVPLESIETGSSIFSTRKLPFVVKLCRAGSGFGTYLVTSEDRRKETLSSLIKFKQRGGEIVLMSSYIDLKQDLSAHFVVGAPNSNRNRDNPLIVGVTVQTMTGDGHWVGGMIDYSAQSYLEDLVKETVRHTTQRLPVEWVGWGGVDIVIDSNDEQWVVDLNPRLTGSTPICLLSNHFYTDRNLPLAQFSAFQYGGTTESLYDTLSQQIKSGQVVVVSATSIDTRLNMADIIWGGKNQDDLQETGKLIRERLAAL